MPHAFAKRVIRIKAEQDALTSTLRNSFGSGKSTLIEPDDTLTDPFLLAAENVSLLARKVDAFKVGPPRASSIRSGCVRFHVIGSKNKLKKKEWSTVKGRVTFGLGNAIHYWVQNTSDIFGDDRRVGWWKCLACGHVLHFGLRPQGKCHFCNAGPMAAEYHEHVMNLKGTYPIGGHPDLFLRFKNDILRVVEIKSINGKDFLKLKAPLADHFWQVQTYMWGCGIDKTFPMEIDREVGYVLYVSKKAHKEFPLKMFMVKRSVDVLEEVMEKATQFKTGIKHYPKRLPPPHPECERGNFGNYRAKSCVCKKECIKYA